MTDPTNPLERLRQALRNLEHMRRVVICHTSIADAIRTEIDRAGIAGLWRVHASDHCPDDTVYIAIDIWRGPIEDGGTPLIPGPETGNTPTPSPDLTTGRAPTHRAGEPPTHPR